MTVLPPGLVSMASSLLESGSERSEVRWTRRAGTASIDPGGLSDLRLLAGLEGLENSRSPKEGADAEGDQSAHDAVGEEADQVAEQELADSRLAEAVDVVGPEVGELLSQRPAQEAGHPVVAAIAEDREGDLSAHALG